MTPQETLQLAVQHDQAGRLDDAIRCYQEVLNLNGLLPQVHNNLGVVYQRRGQLDLAIAALQRSLQLAPDYAAAMINLTGVLCKAGQFDQALSIGRRAVQVRPDLPEAHNNLGNVLSELNQLEEAAAAFAATVKLRPEFVEAIMNLGRTLRQIGRFDEAVAAQERALELAPGSSPILSALADALCATGQYDRAMECCSKAVEIAPHQADAYIVLGACFRGKGELNRALAAYQTAEKIAPSPAIANDLGITLHLLGRLEEAIAQHGAALQQSPDFALAHLNLGLALLTVGDWEQGWAEYEWRLRARRHPLPAQFNRPLWDGHDLGGRRILIHAEQGFGDGIQFARFLPLVAARGGKIILACPPELRSLLRMPEEDNDFEVHCPLLSLAGIFKITPDNIPAAPYISPDPAAAARWRSRMPTDGRLKIGLAWANKPDPADRCPTTAQWAALAGAPGCWLCSLQKGIWPRPELEMTDWTADLQNFSETAALIAGLDLVITVDTAVAHLAGAMGKPTWLVLRKIPDWRWMLDRPDSPWYPSMRLFRQPIHGDWRTPIAQVVEELSQRRRP